MQHVISPDVVVYRPGPDPEIQIYDAKYVARSMVDLEAVRLHAKYARVREHGVPAVRTVLAVHPHRGLSSAWAGYGHLTMCPGDSPPSLALPDVHTDAPLDPARSLGAMVGPSLRSDSHDASQTPDEIYPTAVVADQYWMHRVLGDRRIDLAGLVTAVTEDPSAPRFMVAPDIAQLRGFLGAAADRGWVIEYVEAGNQAAYHNAIVRIVAHLVDDGQIVGVVSGDEALLVRLDDEVTHSWGVFSELAAVPDAAPRFLGRP